LASHGEFLGVEVDVVPHQADHFAFAQAEHEDEGVCGVERVALGPCWFQELAGFFAGPGLRLAGAPSGGGDLGRGCGVFADEVFGDGVGLDSAQAAADVVDGSRWGCAVTASTETAALLFCFGSAGVFVLRAALTCLGNLVDPRLNIPNLEPIESF
jgi:hypothetical protein